MFLLNRASIFLVLGLLQLGSARLREHDESCNNYKASESCRPDLDLICLENVCTCKEMAFYDTERKACIALIGESCTPEQTSSYYGSYGGSYNYYPTISRCPIDAVCEQKDPNKSPDLPDSLKSYEYLLSSGGSSMPNRCLCKRGYYPDDEGQHCIRALGHGEACSEELKNNGTFCDSYAGLTCGSENVCTCSTNENVFYDTKAKRCVTKVAAACNSTTFCEKNSICSTTLEIFKSRYGSSYARSSMGSPEVNIDDKLRRKDENKRLGKCTCQPGYTLNSAGKCVGSFSVACSTHNPCNADKHLSCVDGLCQCQAGAHQAFSSTANSSCVLLPGSACKVDSGPSCSENSECIDGHCQCNKGHSESPSGKCLLAYENECVMADTRQLPYNSYDRMGRLQVKKVQEECNYYQGLSCTGNKCECFDSQLKWDTKKKICMATEGERCGSIAMMRTSEFDYQQEPFYPNAYLNRRYYPGNFAYISSYFVTCAEGLTCTKEHQEIEGWRVCEKSKK